MLLKVNEIWISQNAIKLLLKTKLKMTYFSLYIYYHYMCDVFILTLSELGNLLFCYIVYAQMFAWECSTLKHFD